MGQKSTKSNKKPYHIAREDAGLSREKASELLGFISASRIEKIENNKARTNPEEIVAMAEVYKKPSLCNEFCTNECLIGQKYMPHVETSNLAQITLTVLSSLNSIDKEKSRLIDISSDGEITEDEYKDFVQIQEQLNQISLGVSSLQLWIQQEMANGKIDQAKLEAARKAL